MKDHKIGWLNVPGYIPETWNPVIGCTKVSEGCEHCFAERMAWRLAHNPKINGRYKNLNVSSHLDHRYTEWTGITSVVYEVVDKPQEWKKPRAIFVCDMGDLFHESVSFFTINSVFGVMSDNDQHIYILLTKRPYRMATFYKWKSELLGIKWEPKPNVLIGVTAENQQRANERIPILLSIPAAVRFVSIEPMLSSINLCLSNDKGFYYYLTGMAHCEGMNEPCFNEKLDWVIVGGETGPGARPMQPDWVRSIRDQCKNAEVPFFFKQYGKKILGCELDGQIHHEFPKI